MKQLKKILSILLVLAMVVAYVPTVTVGAEAETKQITLTFDASKTYRTSFSTTKQVWEKDELTFTNEKYNSSNNVADYSNPVRLYKDSKVIFECKGMTQILIVSNGTSDYKNALKNTLNAAGVSYTNSGNNYTITFANPVDSFTLAPLSGQCRFVSVTVTALVGGDEGGETPSDPVMHDVSFDLNGYEGATAPATIQVEAGKPYGDKLPPAPEREGYTFEGWALEDGTVVNAETVVSASHTLYAKWTQIVVEPDPTPGETEPDPTPGEPEGEPTELTITFDDKSKRTQYSTSIQVWEENGIIVTNNKGSGSNVGDYANPARFYKNSNMTVECGGKLITKIVFNANTSSYATALKNSISADTNYTVAISSKAVTVTFKNPVGSFAVTLSADQVRIDSMVVTVQVPVPEEPTKFDVSFDLNYEGAPAAPEARQITEGEAYGELPTPERVGYTFDGWFTEAAYINAVNAETIVTQSHTLYAKWTYIPTEDSSDIVENWGLTLKDEVVVKFNMTFTPETLADAGAYVEVKVDDEITKVAVADVVGPLEIPVSAAQMTDKITLCVVDGNENRGEESVFTILQYCETILGDQQYAQYHQLVKEMLNYGGYAQAYFGHNTENMANEGLEDVGMKDVSADAAPEKVVSGEVDGISYYGASLLLRDKVALRFYFTVTGDIAEYTFKVNGEEVKWAQKKGMYYIDARDILAWNLDASVTVTVNDTLTITNSPMNYIVGMHEDSTPGLPALLKALYNYHLAAQAFVNKAV